MHDKASETLNITGQRAHWIMRDLANAWRYGKAAENRRGVDVGAVGTMGWAAASAYKCALHEINLFLAEGK